MKISNPELLEKHIATEKDSKLKIKLLCLNAIYNGMRVTDAADTFKIPRRTIYDWYHYWNESGYDGLVPTKQSGRPSKLTPREFEELKQILIEKQIFTTKDVKILIQEMFGVNYCFDHVARILREKFKFHHKKPYILSSKRPAEAESILYQRLGETIEILRKDPNFDIKKLAIGFLDESSSQNNANTVRFWSSVNNPTIAKNTKKLKVNTIGFYAIVGNSTAKSIPDSKKETLSEFLNEISDGNMEYEHIIVILDNFKSHHSNMFLSKAKELNMNLVYLPPYSPDLNPIEYIWKSVKRVLSEKNFKSR
jgi:transposase